MGRGFSQRYTGGKRVHKKMLSVTNNHGKANQSHNEPSPSQLLEWLLSETRNKC